MTDLKAYLDKFITFEEREWNVLNSFFSIKKLNKGDYFAVEDRVETNLGFLLKGVVRAFYRNNKGIEYNKTFFTENEFFGPYASLVSGMPNKIFIQSLTDCDIIIADYAKIKESFAEYRKIETLARILAEQLYIEKEKREIELVLLQADERYKLFK